MRRFSTPLVSTGIKILRIFVSSSREQSERERRCSRRRLPPIQTFQGLEPRNWVIPAAHGRAFNIRRSQAARGAGRFLVRLDRNADRTTTTSMTAILNSASICRFFCSTRRDVRAKPQSARKKKQRRWAESGSRTNGAGTGRKAGAQILFFRNEVRPWTNRLHDSAAPGGRLHLPTVCAGTLDLLQCAERTFIG
jgi:hypothetical protein